MPKSPLTPDIKACADEKDLRASMSPIWHYFGLPPTDEAVANFTALMTPERALSISEDGGVVAGLGSFPFNLTTPGGKVRAAGVTMAGVLPTHRRRGHLTALMRRTFEDCCARGEPVAYLWPSEDRIYGRFGYGCVGLAAQIDLAREHAEFFTQAPVAGKARLVPLGEALADVSAVYAKAAAATPGMFARSGDWLRLRTLADPAWRRGDGGRMECVIVDIDGAPAAYGLYRINPKWERGIQIGSVEAIEAIGDSSEATRAVWRHILGMDWTSRITANFLPLDHPLVLLAAEPRRLKLSLRDGPWLRIVDVKTALAARAFGPDETIVIEIADELCPWNAGRWRISSDGVNKTSDAAGLRCDIGALGSAYLGGFAWRQLAASSRAGVSSDDAIVRADRVFERSSAPWCPEIF